MKISPSFKPFIAISCALLFVGPIHGAPPSKTPGTFPEHPGMKHRGGGGMPGEFKENIHSLFSNHKQITRSVEMTKDGYRATTTSEDPKVVAVLQAHVKQMGARLAEGKGVRRWDPAFAEWKDHYKNIKTNIVLIKDGVRAEMVGTTEEAVKVVQNHAGILSRFAEKGATEKHALHPAVLEKNTPAKSGGRQKGGCSGNRCCLKGKKGPAESKGCCKDK